MAFDALSFIEHGCAAGSVTACELLAADELEQLCKRVAVGRGLHCWHGFRLVGKMLGEPTLPGSQRLGPRRTRLGGPRSGPMRQQRGGFAATLIAQLEAQ